MVDHVGNNSAGRTKNSKLNDKNLTSDSNTGGPRLVRFHLVRSPV